MSEDMTAITEAFCKRCLGWHGISWVDGKAYPVTPNEKIGHTGAFRPTVTQELLARILDYCWLTGQQRGKEAQAALADKLTAIIRSGLNLEYTGYGFHLSMMGACVEDAGGLPERAA